MAGTHEGYSLGLRANFTQIEEAKKATNALYSALGEVERRAGNMHMSNNLPREINHIDTVTASYIRRLESEGKTYEANQQKVKAYHSAIAELSSKQKDLETALNRTAASADKNSDAYRTQQIKINQTVADINKFKAGMKSAQAEMDRIRPTGFNKIVHGATVATKATDTMKNKLHSAWNNIRGGATVAAAGIGAVGAAAMSGAKQSAEIQQRYREINNLAVLGGERQKEVTKAVSAMQREGRDISIKYGKSQQEVAAGYEDLVKRGYTTKQALGALTTEVQASVASGDKFSDVTTVSSQVLDAFGMRAKDTGTMLKNTKRVVNELAYSADATSTGFSDLGTAMSYVGTAAKANNISLAETFSALGVLSNNGLESDKAGTALRATINGLTNQINKIGTKNSIFTKLGIKKSEMLDAHGNLKGLSHDMGVLYQHIESHSKGGSDKNGFFKSIFGTSGMNGAMILAKSSKEVEDLTKRTEKAGKTGSYVAKLAAQNMGTAQGSAASAKQAMNAFKMTLGNAVLPALNQASNALAKFLLSKDGEKFQKNVGDVVGKFANGLVSLIRFATQHKTMMKFVGGGFLVGYGAIKLAKITSFVGGLYKQYKDLAEINPRIENLGKTTSQLFTPTKFKDMTRSAKFTVGVSALFNAAQIGNDFYQAATAKTATQRIRSAGAGIGGIVGAGIGGILGGTVGATIGSQLGQAMGPEAAKSFCKAFSGHAAKYFVYGKKGSSSNGKKGSSSNGKYSKKAEQYVHDDYYKLSNHKRKGQRALYAFDENGYYDLKTRKYHDQRSLAERSWGMNHRLDYRTFAHPNNAWDLLSGGANLLWNTAGHLGDKGFWHRSAAEINKENKGSWLDWSGFFDWVRKRKSGDNRNYNPLGRPIKGFSKWIGQQKWDWGPFDSQKNGLNHWLAGFKPQVHGKRPKNNQLQLKASGILPKVNAKKWATEIINDAKKGMKGFPTWTKDLGHKSNAWFKRKWSGMESWAKGVNKKSQSGWNGFTKWTGNLGYKSNKWFKSKWSGMQSWASGIHKNVRAGWQGFQKWLGGLAKEAVDLFKKPFEGLSKWVSDHIPKPVKAVFGSIGKGINWVKSKITGKAHANGGIMRSTHGALVGEAGPELAYKPYANHIRLLGVNGPQFTKIQSGEHILNAHDTRKVLDGGLGHGMVLKGYANGTEKLAKTKKTVTSDYKQIADKSSKSLNSLSKKSRNTWSEITQSTNKEASKTKKNVISHYSQMRTGAHKQMDAMHDGVIDLAKTTSKGFGKELGRMKGYAHDAMDGTISQVNKGISGIDKVLGQFGGNTTVIKPVKFATGTDANGRLTENTLAMVNDAKTGPRQEAIITEKNEVFYPHGKNTIIPLKKGWGVLNGTQTQQVSKSAGLRHFAKGSGVSHNLLKKIASRGEKSPAQSFANMYTHNVHASGPDLNRGTTDLANNSSTKLGVPWMTAMWSVINDAIGGASGKGGTREAFLKYAEETFTGVPYLMGAASKKLSDCSGMVMQALRHFGISIGRTTVAMQHSSGVEYLGKSLSKTIPGDLVIFGHGTGAAGHVGIIKNPRTGTMFNETPPHARVTSIADDKGMGYGYYRVRGLHNASQSKKHTQANIALAKRELGSSAIKWIKDKLGDDFGSLGSFSIGGDLRDRARALAGGLKKLDPRATRNGIAAVLGNWNFESGGLNPGAVNSGGGASGLGQWLGSRLSNLKAYARRHGTSWKNAGTQLSFAVKGEGSDSAILRSILEGHGSVASLANRFSAEWERGGYNAQHVQGAMQIRKALGFAKGGKPKAHTPFIAGERGPELITADGPVKVDTHEQTKHKLSDLVNLVNFPKVHRPTRVNSAPVININFNGPIGGSIEDAKRIAEIVKREITQYLVNIGDELGTDPSLY